MELEVLLYIKKYIKISTLFIYFSRVLQRNIRQIQLLPMCLLGYPRQDA